MLGLTAATQAAPMYCNSYGVPASQLGSVSAAAHPAGLQVSDFTYNGSNSDNCYGVFDSTANGPGNPLNTGSIWGGGFTYLAKFDFGNPGTNQSQDQFDDMTFSIVYDGLTAGGLHQYKLTSNGAVPLNPVRYYDFVGILKQGNFDAGENSKNGGWAGYFFDDVAFDNQNDGGTFRATFGPGNPGDNAWSNLSFYARLGDAPDDPGGGPVPEPTSLALVGIGLLAASYVRRKRAAGLAKN